MPLLTDLKESMLHLVFPQVCAGCGTDVVRTDQPLCLRCLDALPQTRFHPYSDNPVEKTFWGRLPVVAATAHYYFTKNALLQRLMHAFKYKGETDLGRYLGEQLGLALAQTPRFATIDALVPLPLFGAKERARGFNQATVLCEGMSRVLQKPILNTAVQRITATESQTKKNRVDRWQNVEGRFELTPDAAVAGKHLLLVDDVVTTGATLEACGRALLQEAGTQLSIATLCTAAT